MKNFKATKRALLSSVVSLMLCFTMLLGTTFAWFTDSVTSKNNIITAGNLDIELYYKNSETSDWTKVDENTNIFKQNTLWEPGHTEVIQLKVVNEGTLALKYQLGVNVAGEKESVNVAGKAFKLSDYIKYGIVDGAQSYTRAEAVAAVDAKATKLNESYNSGTVALAAKEEKFVTMVVYMPTTVGNEANAAKGAATPRIELGINLFATQASAEEDSFGPSYDEDAWHPDMEVTTGAELQAALNNGVTNIALAADIELTESLVIPAAVTTFSTASTVEPIVIDLNGKTVTIEVAYNDADAKASSAIVNNGNLVLTGKGTIRATNNYTVRNYGNMVIDGVTIENGIMNFAELTVESGNISNSRTGKHTIYGNNAKLTINGGTFHNGNPGNAAIFSYAGEVEINGGVFTIADGTSTLGWTSCLLDAQGNAKFTINNGEVNGEIRDYNNNTVVYGGTFTHNSVNKFLANGYKAVQVDGAWVVSAAIKDAADLQAAIDNAKNGDTILLVQDITSADGVLIADKNLTIDLGGHTFTVSEGASTSNRNIKIIGSSVVTVKNGTLVAKGNNNGGAYGTIRTEGTANVTLENLNLYNYRGGGLNVKAVSGTTVTINNCEIYSQYGGGVEASGGTIVLNDTKIEQKGVYSNGWYSVAMEINSSGKITVNSGEYSGSAIETDDNATMGNCVAFILSSGGTLEINGGTFTGVVSENATATNFCGLIYADRAAVVNINGGTFNSNGAILDMRNNAGSQPNPKATISGGTFSADPRVSGLYASNLISIKEGYVAKENADGAWSVVKDQ